MKSYIPTINISSLLKSEFESKSAINTLKKIEKACVEVGFFQVTGHGIKACLLYTSPSPRDGLLSRMPSSA